MMKKRIQPLYGSLLILCISLIFSACHKSSNPGLAYVPKDANVVLSLNIRQMHDKLKDGNINMDSLMNELKTQDSSFSLLSYADLSVPALLFVQYKSTVMSGQDLLIGWVQPLKDKAGFEKQLVAIKPDKNIVKKDDYSYLTLSDNSCYVWNNDIVAFYSTRNVVDQIPALFKLKKDAAMADDNNAGKLLNTKGDISFYSNSQDGMATIPMLAMTKISDLVKGNYYGGTLNFEKGQVVISGDGYYNKTVEDLIKKNPSRDIDKSVMAHFPGKPLALLQVSVNLKQIFSFLDYAGVTTMIEGYMKNLGFSLDDVAKAFSGEIGIAVQSPSGSTMDSAAPKVLVNVPIADKSSFDKVMGALAKMGVVELSGGQWLPKGSSPAESWAYHSDSKSFVFSTDKALSEAFISGSGAMVYPEDLDFSDKTFVGYADINAIISQMAAGEKTNDSASLNLALQTFEDMDMSATNMNGNHCSMKMTFRLKDKKQNSLPLIISTVQQFKKIQDAKEAAAPVITDSVVGAVPLPKGLEDGGN